MKSWKLIALSATMVFTLFTPAEAAAPIAGNKCPKKNAVVVSAGMSYTCKLVGKKLVWSKGVLVKKSTPTPTPAPTSPISALSDVSGFSNLELCRIVDGDPQLTNMSAGFPIPAERIDLVKGAKIHVIGVDFPDKPVAGKTPRELNEYLAVGTEKFWRAQSSVPVKFDWVWKDSWLRFPGSINSYSLGGSFFEGKFNGPAYFDLANQVIAAVDAETDFSGANFLFIVFPPGVKSEEIGTFLVHTQGTYRTNEGSINNLIMAGGNYANLDTYIHEFGHGLGLTDIRDTTNLAQQQSDGMYYDIMNNPTYPELLVWHRFLLGFLEPSQIHCKVNSETSRHWIVPVASNSQGVKGLVIPLSSTEAIIVESRRAIGFDTKLSYRLDLLGAVVYTLDSKVPYRRTPVKVIEVLKQGTSAVVNGYKISVIESGQFGDVIQVERG